jgi:chemotaxis protein methyltransferase CheR
MGHFGCHTLSQLQNHVVHRPEAFPELLNFLTVPVSDIFRDPFYFRALREAVVSLLRTYPSLKVWVACCSSSEEVYSLAILLREEGLVSRTIIYATEITPTMRRRAEGGVYEMDRIAGFTENIGRQAAGRRYPTTIRRATIAPCSTSR